MYACFLVCFLGFFFVRFVLLVRLSFYVLFCFVLVIFLFFVFCSFILFVYFVCLFWFLIEFFIYSLCNYSKNIFKYASVPTLYRSEGGGYVKKVINYN